MKFEIPTEQLICQVRPELKAGLYQLAEKRSREKRVRFPLGYFVNEALELLLEKEGVPVNGNSSRPVLKKPPSAATPRAATGS
jgi:hypothetical protein